MEILPAIDVWRGRLARFTAGGPEPVEVYDGDPSAAADAFLASGAEWLHVVDMELAYSGTFSIGPLIRALTSQGAKVQASGGVRRNEEVAAMLESGAGRVVVGSAALADRSSITQILERWEKSIAVAIEADGETIRPRGAPEVELPFAETLGWLREMDVPLLVATGVASVGKGGGPDMRLVADCIGTGIPVIASGGISTIEDLDLLASAGAAGAIVGRAALEGSLDLALAVSRFS